MKPTLDGLTPGVWANAVADGSIASSSGSAMVAPTPRRNVRLGNAVFVRNMSGLQFRCCRLLPTRYFLCRRRRLQAHLKGRAVYDPLQQRSKTILLLFRLAHDLSHGRHVLRGEASTQCID